jgi:UDPglucose 6-dehydrogenase
MKVKNICCIGAGYVGGPTMAVIALKCPHINVTVVDSNPEKIKAWNGPLDQLPVFEPGLAEVVEKARGENLFFSSKIKESIENSEMIFMAVNTPTKLEGEGAGMAADLQYIEACARDIAKYSKSDKIVIEKSTLPVRTAEKVKEILIENSSGIHFEILSNPEFLAEGTAIEDLFKSDRVLIGGDQTDSGRKAIKALVDIYANWIPIEKILTTNVWSSELAKLASNAMLAQRISSINSLSALCEKTGANIKELSKAIGMDHRIGKYFLNASVGFGGSCFQKDILNLVYLCQYYELHDVAEYWHQVVKLNDYQKDRVSKKAIELSKEMKSKTIDLLGWSFKKNTNDSRESASINIAIKILKNRLKLNIYDPKIKSEKIVNDLIQFGEFDKNFLSKNIKVFNSTDFLFSDSDVCIIATEWDNFKYIEWDSYNQNRKKIIIDGRNLLDPLQFSDSKIEYKSIGINL